MASKAVKIKADFEGFINIKFPDDLNDRTPPVEINRVQPGIVFYLIDVVRFMFAGVKPRERMVAQPWVGITNMDGGEARINGWLGCTNDVDRIARGKWRVKSIVKRHGGTIYTVMAERLDE